MTPRPTDLGPRAIRPRAQAARLASWVPTGAPSTHRVEPHIPLGPAGRCSEHPTLLIAVYDNSPSVLGGTDATGLRYVESGIAVRRVARRCRCGEDLLAVLHMNRPTGADLSPTPIKAMTRPVLEDTLRVPHDGDGASTLGATLARAHTVATQHPRHRVVLAVFSDFELTDDPASLAADLQAFPGDVHAVVLRAAPPAALLGAGRVTVHEVPFGARPGPVATALFEALTANRVHRTPRRSIRRTAP